VNAPEAIDAADVNGNVWNGAQSQVGRLRGPGVRDPGPRQNRQIGGYLLSVMGVSWKFTVASPVTASGSDTLL